MFLCSTPLYVNHHLRIGAGVKYNVKLFSCDGYSVALFLNLNGGGGDGHWMEVLSRSAVILDLRFFGGGERACGVDERASGVGGNRPSQKSGKEG